jgi:hypothetical protein
MAYDYINQEIQSSTLIVPKDNDPFFFPTQLAFTGYAHDGNLYDNGVRANAIFPPYTALQASWFTEPQGEYRGPLQTFPTASLVLLSKVAMTILDETQSSLPLWMGFLLSDAFALTNNFENALIGFTPTIVTYASGKISVESVPDAGSAIQAITAIIFDFTQDSVYLYTAIPPV